MAIGGSGKNLSASRKLEQRRSLRKQRQSRRMLLENLENRQLMAFGPQLIGVQPNEGTLLQDGQIRSVSPRELVLRFDDQVSLDANTLSGIQLVRAGGDGFFEKASISSDLGSNNLVVLSFTARDAGQAGNGIEVAFTQTNRADSALPRITVTGRRIQVDVNSNSALTSTAQDLINAIDANTAARSLISVTRVRGNQFAPIGVTAASVTPLILSGANAATASTNLNAGSTLQVQLTAQQAGPVGAQTRVTVTTRDRGVGVAPGVTVTGTTVAVELNSNSLTPSTASGFIAAINGNASASALVRASLVSGLGTTLVGNRTINYSPLLLQGGTDLPIKPAYVGLGSTNREVIVRFAEALPDDLYRLEVFGSGSQILRNVNGDAFNNGINQSIQFELDLGAQIESIVPQPVTRDATTGRLVQERNRIDVYFNNDDLNPTLATNPNFYRLLYTRGSGTNADDLSFFPTRVEYNATTDRASLFFNRNLDQLVDPGTGNILPLSELRLRIGTNEATPSAPVNFNVLADAGSSFSTATVLDGTWNAAATTSQSLILSSTIQNNSAFRLDFPGGSDEPGNRDIRPQDHLTATADSVDGISTINYNFQSILGQIDGTLMVNAITQQQITRAREALSLLSEHLGVRFVETDNLGLTIAVGDLRSISGTTLNSPSGTVGVAGSLRSSGQLATVLDIQDFGNSVDNEFGGPFFLKLMQGVGFLLGLGLADELPSLTVMSNNAQLVPTTEPEMVFPGDHDIVHGQFLFRPDSTDIDLYQFTLPVGGRLSIETIAERLSQSSLLDTVIRLYQRNNDGSFTEIASNDDYFSEDSRLQLDLPAGNYIVGISSTGNSSYNPNIEDSGFGGLTQGNYQLRLDFQPPASSVLRDTTGTAIDGDSDGIPGGVHDFWFRAAGPTNTIFVDKAASSGGNGSQLTPFRTIAAAIAVATEGTVIRVVGNGGTDGNVATTADNFSYDIGFNQLGQPLADGTTLDLPRGVTMMIDSGAIMKLRRARIGVGSTSVSVDRSGSALQVLGTPRLIDSRGSLVVDSLGNPVVGSVYFTSIHDRTLGKDANPDLVPPTVAAGDWGGIDFRNRIDSTDANRKDLERSAIFLNYVAHADMRYGGGQVSVDGGNQIITPINMVDSRPTIAHSQISRSADAAISATPNSFKESNFQDPQSQVAGLYTSDVTRIGPDIHGNTLSNNSINGLFVRTSTSLGGTQVQSLTVSGRFDDTDIVHVIAENLTIAGTPGGPILDAVSPATTLVTLSAQANGTLAAGTYNYRITFVDAAGNESAASETTQSLTIAGTDQTIILRNLPSVPPGSQFVARRVYRSTALTTAPYTLVAQINAGSDTLVDTGSSLGAPLVDRPLPLRAQLDASLVIDPGTVVKLQGSRIDVQMGSQLIAEGTDGNPVVFTSIDDNRYGAGGTFSTSNRATARTPVAGDWGGLYVGHSSSVSLDNAVVAFGGGTTRIEGGFAGFNALELHQATARVTNSTFENNAVGTSGTTDADRAGRRPNFEGSIFVRGSQPVLVNNDIVGGAGPAISINVNSLNSEVITDSGRSTGFSDRFEGYQDNQGALIRGNRIGDNAVNGMVVRGQELTTQGVWDDTDIVHIVLDEITVPDFHAFGGLRLESSADSSLVVKFLNSGSNLAGLTATGRAQDIDDRIGGSIQMVGGPSSPVILTSANDCTVGAGFSPDGLPQLDTFNTGFCTGVATVPFADVIVVMDESASMGFAQVFSVSFIASLDAALLRAGVGATAAGGNQFGLVGYGDFNQVPRAVPVGPNGALFGTSAEYGVAAGGLQTSGAIEDGYQAIEFALANYQFRPLAEKFIILVTNEDRDIVNQNLTFASTLLSLNNFDVNLQGIVDADFADANGLAALALDPALNAYLANGNGGFTVTPGGSVTGASGTTQPDYIDLAFATNGLVGDINQIQQGGLIAASFTEVLVTSIVLQTGARPAQGGDWQGVRMDSFSNDRNVVAITETEPSSAAAPGPNSLPTTSQYLGQLAPNLTSGDENNRFGFEVHGSLSEAKDLDVFSFTGRTGTEVWFDIDRTSSSLDTVIELIDSNGAILALSDNSVDEDGNPALLFESSRLPADSVNPLRKSPLVYYPSSAAGEAKDLYSTNPRDAGMRVVLPGEPGSQNLYHVRVRSSSRRTGDSVATLLTGSSLVNGRTSGVYQMQIRLQETDEVPGSSVTYADIRFATNGIELIGLPRHSALQGENAEVERGNTFATVQQLGNLLATDRQALSVAGSLNSATDVDWYSFQLNYTNISASGLVEYFSTVFDIDYADGLGRPNTSLYIYDAQGRLIMRGLDSNIIDDRGSSQNDVGGGSAGTKDPYIGTVELPVGQYFLAVTNSTQVPGVLASSSGVRLQPLPGTRLIVNDRVDTPALAPAETPTIPRLFDPAASVVPHTLGDLVLYVSQDVGIQQTNLYMVNPFSGVTTNTVGRFGFDVQDIAMRFNGTLRGIDRPYENFPAGADLDTLLDYIDINPGTAAAADVGDVGIDTFHLDANNAVTDSNDGLDIRAITFASLGGLERGFFVGSRPVGRPGPQYFSNILYEFDENSGAATSAPGADRAGAARIEGAGTEVRERGFIETNPIGLAQSRELVAIEATEVLADGTTRTIIADGVRFRVTSTAGPTLTFEMNSGPEFDFSYDPANGRHVRDGDRFEINGTTYEFDTGAVVVVGAANGAAITAGTTVRIIDGSVGAAVRTFEFTTTGATSGGNVPVRYTAAATQSELVDALVTAINNETGFIAKATRLANTNRITLTNTSLVQSVLVTGTGVTVEGAPGNTVGLAVQIEETFTGQQILDAMQRAVGGAATISLDGTRLNFALANNSVFNDLINRGILTARNGNGQVGPGAIPVPFLANDDAADIASRIARAISTSGVAGLNATTQGRSVLIAGGTIQSADAPFIAAGVAPGGRVTGIAEINGTLFAVSDNGGLYRVANPLGITIGNIATYVGTSSDLLGIRFQGLTAGPARLANGQMADLLFGIDTNGVIFAFNTAGQLQPVFAGGATSVATGLTNVNGLTFAPLDYNLWHQSGQRGNDAGHGIPAAPDGTRNATNGNQSFYFGFESPAANGVNYTNVTDPGIRNSYNFAGGASGAMVSNPFDLTGVSAADKPVLYFNYFLQTENANSDLNDTDPMLDAFRVYISGEDGVWRLLATNNSERGAGGLDDEFDLNPNSQELFDNTGVWRQARVELGDFAGSENLRLRFEFSTAGSFGYGNQQGGQGPEIRLLGGDRVRDGQSLTVNGVNFELELGSSLIMPAGSSIVDGDSLTIDGVTFVFDDGSGPPVALPNIAVPFSSADTPARIAQTLAALIQANPSPKPSSPGVNFSQEGNDSLVAATVLPINGDTGFVRGSGVIGDNPILVTNPSSDIDLSRMQLSRGAVVTVRVNATTIGSTLDPFVRIFDASGVEIASNDNSNATVNSTVTFTAPKDGFYYIGVSGSGNSTYNPAVFGTTVNGSSGAYQIEVDVTRLLNVVVDGNRIQLEGASSVLVPTGSRIIKDGALGTVGIPVYITSDMTEDEVGAALRTALANALTKGSTASMVIAAGSLDVSGLNVTNSGPFGLSSFLEGDAFGGYNTSTRFDGSRDAIALGALRAQNNNFEGVYIDDFVIGLTERGEMISNAPTDTSFSTIPNADNSILVGPYQLEVRGGSERGISLAPPVPTFVYTEIYEPNERSSEGVSITFFDSTRLRDGVTFTLSDGTRTVIFEFEDATLNNGVQPGNLPVRFSTNVFDPLLGINRPENDRTIAARIRDLINSPLVQGLIKVNATLANGDRVGATNNTVVLFGQVTANVPTESGTTVVADGKGDRNRDRDQGLVVIQSTRVSDSSGFGILVSADTRDAVTGAPIPGPTRNTVVQNTLRQVPGIVIANNELTFNGAGGISISGTTTQGANLPVASVPVARVVNNTIVGGSIVPATRTTSEVFNNQFFELGRFAFADTVVSYTPDFSRGAVPIAGLQVATEALGAPNYTGTGEPVAGQGAVSLGAGGRIILSFTNNLLTGSGDANPDLMIFELGDSERVQVEVSGDGTNFTSVGFASGASPTIDIDAFGFNKLSRLSHVRLTDVLADGAITGNSVGADIDAVGAISSAYIDRYLASGSGIAVANSASPTLLNNVIVNSTTGLAVDASSASTVVGGTLFQRNTNNTSGSATVGQFATVANNNLVLFVDPSKGNFYPAQSSPAIDSSVDSLADRPNMVAVKQPLGMPASPILAPSYDINGLLRVDDPTISSPSGLGENVFKDRGAIDRADLIGPTVTLVNPIDNDSTGLDSNPDATVVELTNISLNFFDIQLVDGLDPSSGSSGSNIDDSTVTSKSIVVTKDRVALVEGIDYRFAYNPTSNIIRLTPLAGVWELDSVYQIRFLSSGANNLQATDASSYTDGSSFTVLNSQNQSFNFEFDLGTVVTVPALANGLANVTDGTVFTVDDGIRRRSFEFDSNNLSLTGNIPVRVLATDTPALVATKIATVLAANGLSLTVTDLGTGQLQIRGSRLTTFLVGNTSLTAVGQPGVRQGFGIQIPLTAGSPTGLDDGETFVIQRTGGSSVRFELDYNGLVTAGNVAVRLSPNMSAAAVGQALVTAIASTGLGVTPVYAGEGLVALSDSTGVVLNMAGTDLRQSGLAGQAGSISIQLPANATAVQVATLITTAINSAGITGVSALALGSNVLVEGSNGVSGSSAAQITSIRDLAGNTLRSNQTNGTTTLTIFLGGGFDYGDAPDPTYTTLADRNGPRHTVVPGFSLGTLANADADARLINADNDDGVQFTSAIVAGFTTNIVVTASIPTGQTGLLDAWIDYDGDGEFEATERIATSLVLSNGANALNGVRIQAGSKVGTTYARFRLSSTGVSSSVGAASDGEVEDYPINVSGNPYQNLSNRLDVSADGFVSAIDALQVINYLNATNGGGPLQFPVPPGQSIPPFLDVNGDGQVSVIDALLVINFLNANPFGGGNPEGEGEGSDLMDGSSQFLATAMNSAPVVTSSTFDLASKPVASYAEFRLGDYLAKSVTSMGPQLDAPNWWLESLDSDAFDALVQDVAQEEENSDHDDFFASLVGIDG